jgi:hypothetical protein
LPRPRITNEARDQTRACDGTDQAGEPGHGTTPGDYADADLEVPEQRVLARREPQVARQHGLAARAAGASADRGDADDWRT